MSATVNSGGGGSKIKDTNNKLPPHGTISSPPRITPVYPWASKTQTVLGGVTLDYQNPAQPYCSIEVSLKPSGEYKTTEINQTYGGLTTSFTHHARGYTLSHSKHSDGHTDESTEATSNKTAAGDVATQVGGDHYPGTAGKIISGSSGDKVEHTTDGHGYTIHGADNMRYHNGHDHKYVGGDSIHSITGQSHTTVTEGDHGFHVQTGSMDIRVEAGQYQLYSGSNLIVNTASNMTITSPLQISIVCGKSSIVMTPSAITITGEAINFVKAS